MKDLESIMIVIGIIFVVTTIFIQLHVNYKKGKKDEQS